MKKLLPEILKEANKLATREERIEFLRQNDSPALRDIIRIAFDKDVVSMLPEGAPPYTPDDAPEGYAPSSLYKKFREFRFYFKGPVAEGLKPLKREEMFVKLLESIHSSEAELLVRAKDRILHKKLMGITRKLCQDAFPGLIAK
jgi:hypothetical protein|tara:strand:- start:424 stop:855 length:432 start_codon:yes stop_codon:yes gene_type:complete